MRGDAVFTIHRGLPAGARTTAVRLYWQAFRGKLAPFLGTEEQALRLLERVADDDHVICAVGSEGQLVGVAGFKTTRGAFIGGGLADLIAIYGIVSGAVRGIGLSLLERRDRADVLMMDGICVSPHVRGHGIGTMLLDAIRQEAVERGASWVRLDVIDSNPRARALYERIGFFPVAEEHVWPLHTVLGFKKTTTMHCAV